MLLVCVLIAGCAQPSATPLEPTQPLEHRVRLVDLAATDGSTVMTSGDAEQDAKWSSIAVQEETPKDADPADYGANPDGEYWQDTIIQAKSYTLDGKITTHTHGVVIYATESITINGAINVRNLGAQPMEQGYSTTRAATMNLYRAYGETDPATGEPQLWGAGSTTPECVSNGGGYVVLNAPSITINGDIDAGSDCGQAGIVILEGNTTGSGLITASLIIHRGTTA